MIERIDVRARIAVGGTGSAGAMAGARPDHHPQAQMATGIIRATGNSGPEAVR